MKIVDGFNLGVAIIATITAHKIFLMDTSIASQIGFLMCVIVAVICFGLAYLDEFEREDLGQKVKQMWTQPWPYLVILSVVALALVVYMYTITPMDITEDKTCYPTIDGWICCDKEPTIWVRNVSRDYAVEYTKCYLQQRST